MRTDLHQQGDRLHERWDGLFGPLDCPDMLHTARSIPVSLPDLSCETEKFERQETHVFFFGSTAIGIYLSNPSSAPNLQ